MARRPTDPPLRRTRMLALLPRDAEPLQGQREPALNGTAGHASARRTEHKRAPLPTAHRAPVSHAEGCARAAGRACALRMAAAGPHGGGYHGRPGPGPRPAAPMQQARERAANPKGMDFAPAVIASLDVRNRRGAVSWSDRRGSLARMSVGLCVCCRGFTGRLCLRAAPHCPRRGLSTSPLRSLHRPHTHTPASGTSGACLSTGTCETTRPPRSPRGSSTGASAGTTGAR